MILFSRLFVVALIAHARAADPAQTPETKLAALGLKLPATTAPLGCAVEIEMVVEVE